MQFDSQPRFCEAFLRFSQGYPQRFPKKQRKFRQTEIRLSKLGKIPAEEELIEEHDCAGSRAGSREAPATDRRLATPPPQQKPGVDGRQAYDRSGKTRDFRRSGQIHSDTQAQARW